MRMRVALLLAFLTAGCRPSTEPSAPEAFRPAAARTGLSDADRRLFYHLEEGSEVFPVDWFLALENEDGTGRFGDNLERFGFLPDPKSAENPYGLPVGLTAADARDLKFLNVKMLGINCAGCHVGQLTTPQTGTVRIDGGPARLDTSRFYRALVGAVTRTLDPTHPSRFVGFVTRLTVGPGRPNLGIQPGTLDSPAATTFTREVEAALRAEAAKTPIDIRANVALKDDTRRRDAMTQLERELGRSVQPRAGRGAEMMRAEFGGGLFQNIGDTIRLLKARLVFIARIAGSQDPGGVEPGFGRLDAFGGARILLWQDRQPTAGPVSYPDLWTFERLAWVHWDANTNSVLERNIGQALGLGAVVDESTLASTVSVVNLRRLEELATRIQPPRWNTVFAKAIAAEVANPPSAGAPRFTIDSARAARGKTLFDGQCASCHVARMADLVPYDVLGAVDRNRADSFGTPLNGKPNEVVIADLIGRIRQKACDEKGFTADQCSALDGGRKPVWRAPKLYAAPPLTAIWASAPYLHNNSVPTLRDLLSDEAARPKVFFTGRSDYDVVKLGLITDDDGKGRFRFDTSTAGNRNAGHLFGTKLTDAEKDDLLEYLKVF